MRELLTALFIFMFCSTAAARSSRGFDVYFAPYDQVTAPPGYPYCNGTALEYDLCVINQTAVAAKAAGKPCKNIDSNCPYQVKIFSFTKAPCLTGPAI